MTDIIERMKEALGEHEKALFKYGNPPARDVLAMKARTLLPEAIEEIKRLEAKLAEVLGGQPYTYYGKDGKPILARDLEDRAEAAEAKLAVAVGALEHEVKRSRRHLAASTLAALTEIKGE